MRNNARVGALLIVTGRSVDVVDSAWRARIQDSPLQFAPLTDEGVWWGLGALLVPLAWLVVRRRNRRKIDRWRREEVLEDALYRTLERTMGTDWPASPADDPSDPSGEVCTRPMDELKWH